MWLGRKKNFDCPKCGYHQERREQLSSGCTLSNGDVCPSCYERAMNQWLDKHCGRIVESDWIDDRPDNLKNMDQ